MCGKVPRSAKRCRDEFTLWLLPFSLSGFKKASLQNPREMIRGQISVNWFGFGPESQSFRPKVGVTDRKSELQPGRPPESEPNRPEKGPEWPPRKPGEASWCRDAKIAARQFLPLNCRAITLTTGAILKEEKMSSTVGERQFGRHFKRQFGRG